MSRQWGNHQQDQQRRQAMSDQGRHMDNLALVQQRPPPIVVQSNDVLKGRGVCIANHPGNERFRALVQDRYDPRWNHSYSTQEKKAVAQGIINHIKKLDPPGRFIVQTNTKAKGLEGPWVELDEKSVLKKTLQALRDCNRTDRSGYASRVSIPADVRQQQWSRSRTGLSQLDLARHAVAAAAFDEQQQRVQSQSPLFHPGAASLLGKRSPSETPRSATPAAAGPVPVTVPNAKRQRLQPPHVTVPTHHVTPVEHTVQNSSASASATMSRFHDPIANLPGIDDFKNQPPVHFASLQAAFQEENTASPILPSGFLPQGDDILQASSSSNTADDRAAAPAPSDAPGLYQHFFAREEEVFGTDGLGGGDVDDDDADFPPPSPLHTDNLDGSFARDHFG